jgi:hypothetical protein
MAFDAVSVEMVIEDHIQDTRSNHNQGNSQGIVQDRLDTRKKGVSLATIIMISFLLRNSSDGF